MRLHNNSWNGPAPRIPRRTQERQCQEYAGHGEIFVKRRHNPARGTGCFWIQKIQAGSTPTCQTPQTSILLPILANPKVQDYGRAIFHADTAMWIGACQHVQQSAAQAWHESRLKFFNYRHHCRCRPESIPSAPAFALYNARHPRWNRPGVPPACLSTADRIEAKRGTWSRAQVLDPLLMRPRPTNAHE